MSGSVAIPLIPVKALAEAKGRLGPELGPIERRLLAIAMLEDVLDAVRATEGLGRPVVVSPDREVWRRADALGCAVVEEPAGGGGLDAALRLAAAAGHREGGGGLLVVAADLPLATAGGLGRVRQALAGGAPVVVAPSRDGTGTNVLGWGDPASFSPAFGPGSAARHLEAAGAVRVEDEGLALDVDTVEDLRLAMARLDPASVTGRRVRDLRLRERLTAGAGA